MSDPLNPYPGSMKRHTVIEGGRAAGKNAAIIAKQAELIQRLVDALALWPDTFAELKDQITTLPGEVDDMDEACVTALAAAEAQGFKPTEQ